MSKLLTKNKNEGKHEKLVMLIEIALLTAIVVVLQLMGAVIRFGTFSVSLVLVPIVIGAILCGPLAGAWLGFVFGVVVLLSGDAAAFYALSPAGTIFLVLLKGTLAGLFAGLVYRALTKKSIEFSIFLSIITFGIYSIFWKYRIIKATHKLRSDDSGCAAELICCIFLPFYSVYWWYTRGTEVEEFFDKNGIRPRGRGNVYLILSLLGLNVVSRAIMQRDLDSLPGDLYSLETSKTHTYISSLLSAVACPVVNTGVFLIGCLTIFRNYLQNFTDQTIVNPLIFVVTVFIGFNFLFELALNVIVAPAIARIADMGRKMLKRK